jgi:hypothetical protein
VNAGTETTADLAFPGADGSVDARRSTPILAAAAAYVDVR